MRRCPLCKALHCVLYHQDRWREYYQCSQCALVFVPHQYHLDAADEKAEYDRHQNSPHDTGYRRFLGRLFDPLVARLEKGARGLDFGAGPGPTLSVMLSEAGFSMAIYDIYYAPDPAALDAFYDFITATEVVEHLAAPGEVLARLHAQLGDHGVIGVMTKRVTSVEAFARWHYINDPTHVCFFSETTFRWWAEAMNMTVEFPGSDTAIFKKR